MASYPGRVGGLGMRLQCESHFPTHWLVGQLLHMILFPPTSPSFILLTSFGHPRPTLLARFAGSSGDRVLTLYNGWRQESRGSCSVSCNRYIVLLQQTITQQQHNKQQHNNKQQQKTAQQITKNRKQQAKYDQVQSHSQPSFHCLQY